MLVCKSNFLKNDGHHFQKSEFLLLSSRGKPRDDKVSFHTLYRRCTLYISLYHLDIHQMLLDLGLLGQDLESRNCSQVKTERNDSGLVSFTNLYMAILKRIVDIIWCLNASYLSKNQSRFLSILIGRCRTHCVQQVKY